MITILDHKKLAVFLLLLLCPVPSYGDDVSGVSGTVSNGNSITVSTAGNFGSGPTVVLFDNFEGNGTNTPTSGQQLQANYAPVNNASGGVYSIVQSAAYTSYSTSVKVSGNFAARFVNTGFPADQHPMLNLETTSTFNDFYISWYQQYPNNLPGWSIPSVNWKTIWIMGECCGVTEEATDININTNGSTAWLLMGNDDPEIIYPMYLKDPAGTGTDYTSSSGSWQRFQFYEKAEENSTGIDQVTMTDASGTRYLLNQSNVQTIKTGRSDHRYQIFINGYVRDTENADTVFDDIYFAVGDNARARVEIGNASTYANCTSLAVCTPTSWSSSSVTCTVRQGNLAAESNAWVYVTEADGTQSPGYAVTIGEDEVAAAILTGGTLRGGSIVHP